MFPLLPQILHYTLQQNLVYLVQSVLYVTSQIEIWSYECPQKILVSNLVRASRQMFIFIIIIWILRIQIADSLPADITASQNQWSGFSLFLLYP